MFWRPPSSVHKFKHPLLPNCLANQNQFLCGPSMVRWSASSWHLGHSGQDGRHAHIYMEKPFQKILLWSQLNDFHRFPPIFNRYDCDVLLFSSPEPLGSQGELIVYPSSRRPSVVRPSVVRPSTIFKDFLL